jgi:hypothetical protein
VRRSGGGAAVSRGSGSSDGHHRVRVVGCGNVDRHRSFGGGGGSLGHGQWQKGWFADEGVGREVEVRGKPEEDGRRRLNGDTEEASPNGKTGKGLRGRVTPRQTFVSSVRCSSDNAGSKK